MENPEQLDFLEKERLELKRKKDKVFKWYFIIPLLHLLFTAAFIRVLPVIIFTTVIATVFSALIYYASYTSPFNDVKNKLKRLLLNQFMDTYHPDIKFKYNPRGKSARSIIRRSELILADKYLEEDVISGKFNKGQFYISEINLKRKSKDSSYSIFKGILFKLKLPGRKLPHAHIQNKLGLLTQIIGSFKQNKEYDFYYETHNEKVFNRELQNLFPFIKHLMGRINDLRIETKGDEITILMGTPMKFLDEPKPELDKTFNNKTYFTNLGKQLNSLLFIVETFANDLNKTEIEERLELKILDKVEAYRRKE